ncbi:winged helix-turn-helix transcriptional regulator [Lentzea sp. NPDC058436]|uniref:winged helix-turn-helix transcriptional regulator n=1 Tax=Lentzea sp. NPDC058436 TaxID=3346499 RepID=UPI003658B92A
MSAPHSPAGPEACDVREALDLVTDKWSLYIVSNLSAGPRRFNELRRAVNGITQRMLTLSLRNLERDGIVARTVHEVMPPRVSYRLTPLGAGLLEAAAPLIAWSAGHVSDITAARARYDVG